MAEETKPLAFDSGPLPLHSGILYDAAASRSGITGLALRAAPDNGAPAGLPVRVPSLPASSAGPGCPEAAAHLAALRRWLASPSSPAPPADVRGTPFQIAVWKFLAAIPRGETRTYQEVARALGAPRAARAVARACAANRVALLIPCHRVTGSDGSLRGYRWGAHLKRLLLAAEAAAR